MKLKQLTIIITLILTTSISIAGNEFGNGGDIVYCPQENGNPTVEMLDLYEARARWGLTLDLGPDNLAPIEKVNYVLDRLDSIDHFRAEYYRNIADAFFDNVLFLSGITLIDVPDSQFTYIPSNCEIRQIAIQKTPKFPGEMLYTISQDLWDLLDNNNKAGLILHEIVYGEAILLEHPNSIDARYFMGHLASNIIEEITSQDYSNLFNLTNFIDAGRVVNGVRYNIDKLTFYNDGRVKVGSLFYPILSIESNLIYPHLGNRQLLFKNVSGNSFLFESRIEFYENGKIKKGNLVRNTDNGEIQTYTYNTDYKCQHLIEGERLGYLYPGEWIEFQENGKLKRIELVNDDSQPYFNYIIKLFNPNTNSCYEVFPLENYGKLKYIGRSIDFYQNGMLKSLFVNWPQYMFPVFEQVIPVQTGFTLHFYENGFIQNAVLAEGEHLTTTKGVGMYFQKGSILEFNSEGKVIVD